MGEAAHAVPARDVTPVSRNSRLAGRMSARRLSVVATAKKFLAFIRPMGAEISFASPRFDRNWSNRAVSRIAQCLIRLVSNDQTFRRYRRGLSGVVTDIAKIGCLRLNLQAVLFVPIWRVCATLEHPAASCIIGLRTERALSN